MAARGRCRTGCTPRTRPPSAIPSTPTSLSVTSVRRQPVAVPRVHRVSTERAECVARSLLSRYDTMRASAALLVLAALASPARCAAPPVVEESLSGLVARLGADDADARDNAAAS